MFLRYQHSNYAGDFRSRLQAFNLDQHFNRYPLLVKYDWLRPAFHVPMPEAWFRNWERYPNQPAQFIVPEEHWAHAHNYQLSISESQIGTEEWFVHPLLRKGPSRSQFFDHAVSDHENFSWQEMHHSEGRNFVPAFDYFYEWQIFRFADVVHWMRGDHPHFWQPGAHANLIRYASETTVVDFDRSPQIPAWNDRAVAFTWVAHYLAFDDAFTSYTNRVHHELSHCDFAAHDKLLKKQRDDKRIGARQLMAWLNITPASLEYALKHQLLTLAQEWRWRNYDKTDATLALWRALQTQLQATVEWLCLVRDKNVMHYLDAFRYEHLGQEEWAQLEEVLEYPIWRAARTVSTRLTKETSKYFGDSSHSLAARYAPTPVELLEFSVRVPLFDSYMDAIWRLRDEGTRAAGGDPFRPRSRTSWYRVIAIIGFMMLEDAIGPHKKKRQKPMQAVATRLASKGDEWAAFNNGLRDKPEVILSQIATAIQNVASRDELILYFCLAVHHVRNSTAHPYGAKHDWLDADWAGPIFEALVIFVPWALMELHAMKMSEPPVSPARTLHSA